MEERVLGGKRFTWFGQDAKNANAKPNPKNLPVGVSHLLPLQLLARAGGEEGRIRFSSFKPEALGTISVPR